MTKTETLQLISRFGTKKCIQFFEVRMEHADDHMDIRAAAKLADMKVGLCTNPLALTLLKPLPSKRDAKSV